MSFGLLFSECHVEKFLNHLMNRLREKLKNVILDPSSPILGEMSILLKIQNNHFHLPFNRIAAIKNNFSKSVNCGSKLFILGIIVCNPFLLANEGGWLSLQSNFRIFKMGVIDKISIFRGVARKEGGHFFYGGAGGWQGCSFYIKNKPKSEILNDIKSL